MESSLSFCRLNKVSWTFFSVCSKTCVSLLLCCGNYLLNAYGIFFSLLP